MLDCWRVKAVKRNPLWVSLQAFAEAKPDWELITDMSESIVDSYVAGTPHLSKLRRKTLEQRDQVFENQILRNRDELLYVELCHAMNAGDIGRVETSFLPWTYIFKATGKHKYTWGSGPLLCMAGYSSQCELFFIMSKFYFDRVDPLEPNLLMLDNIDIE